MIVWLKFIHYHNCSYSSVLGAKGTRLLQCGEDVACLRLCGVVSFPFPHVK